MANLRAKLEKEQDSVEKEFINSADAVFVQKKLDKLPQMIGAAEEDLALQLVLEKPFRERALGKEYYKRKTRERVSTSNSSSLK
ncbi:MAG: hypothetical protein KGH94_03745 [Candidatus Micrarchaeota archaeon]|nr:hypothetical protein [Candidatus Micrarchaeota archaeon]